MTRTKQVVAVFTFALCVAFGKTYVDLNSVSGEVEPLLCSKVCYTLTYAK